MLNVENVLVMSLCVSYVRFYVLFVFRNIETVCSTTSEMDCAETWFALVSLKTSTSCYPERHRGNRRL